MKIAVHQMCSGIAPENNISRMVNAIGDAKTAGAAFYFAPEMSILLDRDRSRSAAHVEMEDGKALQALRIAAADARIWVHLGSMAVRDSVGGKLANRSLIIDDRGNIAGRYDKMHLFDVDLSTGETWRESSAYAAGTSPVIVQTPLGRMGLSICYDMRFPDLYSTLSKNGADIFAVPAAFTVPTGRAHWHALLRARAIESEAFVVAAAQCGTHEDGRQTYGHSLVIDPWGDVLLDMGQGEGIGFADIDLTRLNEVRTQIPVHANRRDIGKEVKFY